MATVGAEQGHEQPRPVSLTVRMYQVGFGDCFLLTFKYDRPLEGNRAERHILIDFGTTALPAGLRSLAPVASDIRDRTQGAIDVVVVTHRHRDHLSAFGTDAIAEMLMADGFPRLVVRSWTEDPTISRDARAPTGDGSPVGPKSLAFLRTVDLGEEFALALHGRLEGATTRSLAGSVRRLIEDQLTNRAAVDRLASWSRAGTGSYLHYGLPSGIESHVPGIGVHVLGPPTIDQHAGVRTQRHSDPDEFWMLYSRLVEGLSHEYLAGLVRDATAASDDDGAADGETDEELRDLPRASSRLGSVGPVRWLTERLGRQQLNSLRRIVRILDDVLNNTSLILLFEVPSADGPMRLLFSGDAQIENWEYALKYAPEDERERNRDMLRTVDVYKVGHHGSRNATPRTLFNLWLEEGTRSRPMAALLSTKLGVHGHGTSAVPRETLVSALKQRLHLYSTHSLEPGIRSVELTADLRKGRAVSTVTTTPAGAVGSEGPYVPQPGGADTSILVERA